MDALWISLLVVAGTILLVVEIFMPGMVLGILGAACLLGSVIWTFQIYGLGVGAGLFLFEVIGVSIGLLVIMERLPFSRWGKSMMLGETNPSHEQEKSLKKFVGQNGKAVSLCRPAGIAQILGERIDVISESGFIEEGRSIIVTRVEGVLVRVREQESSVE